METTLVIYERGTALRPVAALAARLLGPSRLVELGSGLENPARFANVAFVFSPEEVPEGGRMSAAAAGFFADRQEVLRTKRLALLCVSDDLRASGAVLSEMQGRFGSCIYDFMRLSELAGAGETAGGKDEALCRTRLAERLIQLKRRLREVPDMPRGLLEEKIAKILLSHNTCTLCTGAGAFVRATPIEYVYREGALYMISEGGEKFACLAANPRVAVAVYAPYTDFDSLEGLQIEGTASLVRPFSEEYLRVMEAREITEEKLRALPASLSLIRVRPGRIEVLKSAFTDEGYRQKQIWTAQEG